MDIAWLENIIRKNEIPDISKRFELKVLVDQYPYFQPAVFIYLKCLYSADDKLFRSELQRLFVFIKDRKALFYYVLKEKYERFFKKDTIENTMDKSRTDILLNAFFETLDDNAIDRQLEHLLPKVDLVTTDYFAYTDLSSGAENITNEADVPSLKHQGIIDRFINNPENTGPFNLQQEESDKTYLNQEQSGDAILDDDLFFTETLAHIYIKQHKYERAYEIIKRLSLNYPEKNIYFANQISFLEKLIINSKVKNKR